MLITKLPTIVECKVNLSSVKYIAIVEYICNHIRCANETNHELYDVDLNMNLYIIEGYQIKEDAREKYLSGSFPL